MTVERAVRLLAGVDCSCLPRPRALGFAFLAVADRLCGTQPAPVGLHQLVSGDGHLQMDGTVIRSVCAAAYSLSRQRCDPEKSPREPSTD